MVVRSYVPATMVPPAGAGAVAELIVSITHVPVGTIVLQLSP